MSYLVIVLHSTGDEPHAVSLADAIHSVGYEVWHTGLTSVGDIELKELSDRLAQGGPIVICGTARAAGSKWLRKILAHVQGSNSLGKPRVFPVRLEIDADLEAVGLSVKVAECYPDFKQGISELTKGLIKHYPVDSIGTTAIEVVTAFLGDHPHLQYDRRPVLAHGVEALDQEVLQRFFSRPLSRLLLQKAGIMSDDVNHSVKEKLNALGCICDGHPTLGAFLCFARRELLTNQFSGCSLQMVVFDQIKRGPSAPSIELAQDNLLSLYDEGMSWFTKEAGLKRRGKVGRTERDDLEIPELALHEALANALVHRDYETGEIKEQPTRLEVFPDRVEITSFGNLPAVVSVDSLNSDGDEAIYWRRNPMIAQIFLLMSRVELNASGVSRMRSEMERASLGFPRFVAELHRSVVRVVLPRPSKIPEETQFATANLVARPGQLRVMLSSTLTDLQDHLHQVRVTCFQLGMFPVLAEKDTALDTEEAILEMVHDADVFVGIYGMRYGSVPEGSLTSLTEMEFEAAAKQNIPMLLFMMHEDHPVTRDMLEKDERANEKLLAFKARVAAHYSYDEFRSPEELRGKIEKALRALPVVTRAKRDTPDFKADISRIIKYAPAELIGREDELKLLSDAWQQAVHRDRKRPHILTFVALGGEGKTSLVANWAAELAHQGWPQCEAAFAWSFYSQGTSEKAQASSDSFLKEALLFCGDVEMANSAASSFDKGRRLAQLVGERRSLLILDGVEPLQYAPTSPTGSELKDQGVAALLRALATNNNGLCIVTTRYSIPDLRNFWQTTAPEIKLKSLSIEAGVALLRRLGVKGIQAEFEQLVRDVKGHALTLNLLGSFLRDAHGGDIRKRDLVKLEEADAEEQSGQAFHVMDAYVKSFKEEGEKGMRALSVLRLLGLFDRPATADSLHALWTSEEIEGLTGPLLRITEAQRNITLKRLEDAGFITVNRNEASELVSLDAHPLLREYFAARVRQQMPGAWLAAHRRLYEHLRDTTNEGEEPTLEDLQPLYQAVAHGCQAGLQEEACESIYHDRILRGDAFYSVRSLGAVGSDLSALARFFEVPWIRLSPNIAPAGQAWLLNEAAFRLRALGRLLEALEPMRVALRYLTNQENWRNAAATGSNLSELELTLGEVAAAVVDSEESVVLADRSGDKFLAGQIRGTHAEALNQAGRRAAAEAVFREAEEKQAERQPDYPLMYSLQGFRYCDLLLTPVERSAWRQALSLQASTSNELDACDAVFRRATQTLKWAEEADGSLLSIALDHLSLGRAGFYMAILKGDVTNEFTTTRYAFDAAVVGLRRAGTQDHLPRGLLGRAWLRSLEGKRTGSESAQKDLDEAWEISERGPMRLFMADIHLYRARLFHAVKPYPWNTFPDGTEGRGPKNDLADARELIEKCGYWRRKEELEDAEEAAKGWT